MIEIDNIVRLISFIFITFLASCSLFPKHEQTKPYKWYHQKEYSWKSPANTQDLNYFDYYVGFLYRGGGCLQKWREYLYFY